MNPSIKEVDMEAPLIQVSTAALPRVNRATRSIFMDNNYHAADPFDLIKRGKKAMYSAQILNL
jgi:hypothetical protein